MIRPIRKIAFVSPHCVLDFTNGAATATLDGLTLLARVGFQCQAFAARGWTPGRGLVEDVSPGDGEGLPGPQRANRRVPGADDLHDPRPGAGDIFSSASTRGGWVAPKRSRPSSPDARFS